MHIALGTAKHGNIMGENTDPSPIYSSMSDYNAISRRTNLVFHQHIKLFEAAWIEEQVYTFTGCKFTLLMFLSYFLLTTPNAAVALVSRSLLIRSSIFTLLQIRNQDFISMRLFRSTESIC
jgi:hypothetical protein